MIKETIETVRSAETQAGDLVEKAKFKAQDIKAGAKEKAAKYRAGELERAAQEAEKEMEKTVLKCREYTEDVNRKVESKVAGILSEAEKKEEQAADAVINALISVGEDPHFHKWGIKAN